MRLSVLINNHNNGPFLREAIDSVLIQDPPADEVIVYDDGSTDDSPAILRSYGERIRLVLAPKFQGTNNAAQSAAIAGALALSSGEVISLLDGDDAYLPGRHRRYLNAFQTGPDVTMVQSPARLVDPGGRFLGLGRRRGAHATDLGRAIRRSHNLDRFYPTSALATRREVIQAVVRRPPSEDCLIALDARLAFQAVLAGRVVSLTEPGQLYRVRPGSWSAFLFLDTFHRLRLDRQRVAYFNQLGRDAGWPPLRLWRDLGFYPRLAQQVLRWAVRGARRTIRRAPPSA